MAGDTPSQSTTRRYVVKVDGFEGVEFRARSASAARYAAFRAIREAGYRYTFPDFLRRVSVLHMGAAHG